MIRIQRTLQRTVEFEPIPVRDAEPLRFRLEVFLESDSQYSARLYRVETYKCSPRFSDFGPADTMLTIVEQTLIPESLRATSEDAMVAKAQEILGEMSSGKNRQTAQYN